MRDYTKIKAWQLADDLTVEIYRETKHFPRDEVYALTSQIRRAAYSVPANITEGSSRNSHKDYLHFLYIARGSLSETRYFIHLSERLGYFTKDQAQSLTGQAEEASKTLVGLIQAVEKEANPISRTVAKLSSLLVLSIGSTVCSLN
jgi:four helix bundle protein